MNKKKKTTSMSTSKGTDESLRIEQFQNYINPFNIYAEIFYQ